MHKAVEEGPAAAGPGAACATDEAPGRGETTRGARAPAIAAARWARLNACMDELLQLPQAAHGEFIAVQTRADAELGAQLAAWARALGDSEGFLEQAPSGAVECVDDSLQAGAAVGVFRIERLLGRGGMGEVYAAARADGQFEQRVAIKIIHREFAADPALFLAERRLLAGFDHPGVTRLFDGGLTDDARPYMVMELVDGEDLLAYCQRRQLGLRARLDLFLQLCDAVAYAHRRLVVHGDIKPNNVLVTGVGSVKLLDFGVAHLLGGTQPAVDGILRLTPGYAAPEQLAGEALTTATDVYALGGLLYRLLTGVAPLDLSTQPAILAIERVLKVVPPLMSVAARERSAAPLPWRRLRGDLDAIVAKALSKDPQQRYGGAEALKADLLRYLHHEPVTARVASASYVMWRYVQRHRWLSGAVAVVALTLVVSTFVVLDYAQRLRVQRDLARDGVAAATDLEDYVGQVFGLADQGESAAKPLSQILEAERQRIIAHPDTLDAQTTAPVLGDLYLLLNDNAGAESVWQDYLRIAPPGTPPVRLADAHGKLATIAMRLGHVDDAAREVAIAKAYWQRDPDRYLAKLIETATVEAYVHAARGDTAGAIRIAHDIAERCRAVFGSNDLLTASAYSNFAIALQRAGRLAEAREATRQAYATLVAADQGFSSSGLKVLNNIANYSERLGDVSSAESEYRTAIAARQRLYGPSAALAVLLNNHGRLLTRLGRGGEAEPELSEAKALAQRYAGGNSRLDLICRINHARALVVLRRDSEAEAELRQALADTAAVYGEHHLIAAHANLVMAQLRIAQGRNAEAQALLEQVEAELPALGAAAQELREEMQTLQALLSAPRH